MLALLLSAAAVSAVTIPALGVTDAGVAAVTCTCTTAATTTEGSLFRRAPLNLGNPKSGKTYSTSGASWPTSSPSRRHCASAPAPTTVRARAPVFMQNLMTGKGTRDDYIALVAQHYFIYEALEAAPRP